MLKTQVLFLLLLCSLRIFPRPICTDRVISNNQYLTDIKFKQVPEKENWNSSNSNNQNPDYFSITIGAITEKDTLKQKSFWLASNADTLKIKNPANNLLSSITGHYPGVYISTSTGQYSGGSRVLIRGIRSLASDNQPLFLLDGVPVDNSNFSNVVDFSSGYSMGSMILDLNVWDIESIEILNPTQSTIYGVRGKNGVVEIRTKSGLYSNMFNLGVDYNSSVAVEGIDIYPKYQKQYGGGSSLNFETVNIDGQDYLTPQYRIDMSWGPRFDPNIKVLHWNAFDSWDSENYLNPKPWVYPKNDYRYFFNRGYDYQNNVQLHCSYHFFTLKASYTNNRNSGIYPNSSYTRNTFNINTNLKFKEIVKLFTGFTYIDNETEGRPYNMYKNLTGSIFQWTQTSVDYKALKSFKNPDGTQRTWNRISWDDPRPSYADNPYWASYNNLQNDYHHRYLFNAHAQINPFSWLSLNGRFGLDNYELTNQNHFAVGSTITSGYNIDKFDFGKIDYKVYVNLNKDFSKIGLKLDALAGISRGKKEVIAVGAGTIGGLIVPNIYSLSNSVGLISYYTKKTEDKVKGLFAQFSTNFKEYLTADVTIYQNKTIFFGDGKPLYAKSIELGFFPIRAFDIKSNTITGSRIYGNIAQYQDGANQIPMNSTIDPEIKPEKNNHIELGLDLEIFNRFNLGFAFFNINTVDGIMYIPRWGSGFIVRNFSDFRNSGVEFNFSGDIIQVSPFRWNFAFNFSRQSNRLDENKDISFVVLYNSIIAPTGQAFPKIYGTDYTRDSEGNILVDLFGNYLKSGSQTLGNVTPDFFGALINHFTFKNFQLDFLIDFQHGGHTYYSTYEWGMSSGILKETSRLNENGRNIRDDISAGGGVLIDGVYGYYDEDTRQTTYYDSKGNTVNEPVKNTTRITASSWAVNRPDVCNVFSTDYIKLREISLSYDIPLRSLPVVKDMKVSIFGRNLATLRASEHFDPEFIQDIYSFGSGYERTYMPSTRTYGLMLNLRF